nr:hypothetical protein [Woeseiaceae bacterium]
GAIAVLVTLVYLARQIHLNTNEIRASRVEGTLRDQSTYNRMLAEDPDLARIYWIAVDDVEKLSEDDKRRWLHLCSVMLRNSEIAYYHYRQGHLPDPIHLSREKWIRRFMGTSGFRWWWKQYSDVLDPEFVEYVDRVLADDAT